MPELRRWTGVSITGVMLCACGGAEPSSRMTYADNAREAYESAMEDFADENCMDAEPAFRSVRRDFPYASYAALAELRLADCLFMQDKFAEAIEAYRQFARQRPSHSEVRYARFRMAESYFKQIPTDWFLSPPPHELDQGPTREALRQLRRFITDYPDDDRVPEAERMVREALTILAQHELYVARLYLDRGAPAAAVTRLEGLLSAYEGASVEAEALVLLGKTYLELEDRERARAAFDKAIERFPASGYAVQAREFLRAMSR